MPALWIIVGLTLLVAGHAWAGPPPVRSLIEMRHQGVIIQEWDLSCGAAALATVLKYQHGDPVPEREIALSLIERPEYIEDPHLVQARHGFSLLDLARYVESRGYRGIGYGQLSLEDLVERAPIVVPVDFHGYNHFVVFRGIRDNRVLLADPAWGNRTLTADRFLRAWISFPELGHVGFVVARNDGSVPQGQLAPRESEFVMVR